MMLTDHFSLEEMTMTTHLTIDNSCPQDLMENLLETANILEQVRKILKVPMTITSGYRCVALNTLIGGSKKSAHMDARASDFIAPAYGPPVDVCGAIAMSSVKFDQLINEMNRWIHIGIAKKGAIPRRDILTMVSPGNYVRGLLK